MTLVVDLKCTENFANFAETEKNTMASSAFSVKDDMDFDGLKSKPDRAILGKSILTKFCTNKSNTWGNNVNK